MTTTLRKKTRDIFTALFLLGLSAACALMTTNVRGENLAGQATIQSATTSSESEHRLLAKSHEDKAAELWVKAKEQKQLLEHYEEKSYLYGKRAQDLQAHTWALIRNYELAATARPPLTGELLLSLRRIVIPYHAYKRLADSVMKFNCTICHQHIDLRKMGVSSINRV